MRYFAIILSFIGIVFTIMVTETDIFKIETEASGAIISLTTHTISILASVAGFLLYFFSISQSFTKSERKQEEITRLLANSREDVNESLKSYGLHLNEVLDTFEPKEIEGFRRVFGNANKIFAYNPPLNLLINEKDHRDVILSVLERRNGEYNLVCGKLLEPRVKDLGIEWLADTKSRAWTVQRKKDALSKFKVTS